MYASLFLGKNKEKWETCHICRDFWDKNLKKVMDIIKKTFYDRPRYRESGAFECPPPILNTPLFSVVIHSQYELK